MIFIPQIPQVESRGESVEYEANCLTPSIKCNVNDPEITATPPSAGTGLDEHVGMEPPVPPMDGRHPDVGRNDPPLVIRGMARPVWGTVLWAPCQ